MAQQSVFLVDTSVLIAHLRQTKSPSVLESAQAAYGVPVTSDIVVFELEVGARRAGREFEFRNLFKPMHSYPLTRPILIRAADIQAALLSQNKVIGLPDTFIAATALEHDIPLLHLPECPPACWGDEWPEPKAPQGEALVQLSSNPVPARGKIP